MQDTITAFSFVDDPEHRVAEYPEPTEPAGIAEPGHSGDKSPGVAISLIDNPIGCVAGNTESSEFARTSVTPRHSKSTGAADIEVDYSKYRIAGNSTASFFAGITCAARLSSRLIARACVRSE